MAAKSLRSALCMLFLVPGAGQWLLETSLRSAVTWKSCLPSLAARWTFGDPVVAFASCALGLAVVVGMPFLLAPLRRAGCDPPQPPMVAADGTGSTSMTVGTASQSPAAAREGLSEAPSSRGSSKALPLLLTTDRTEENVSRSLNLGQRLSLSHGPSLRVAWDRRRDPEHDHLKGQVTLQERLWGVIVTMGIAAMRDQIFLDQDVVWYILHFFCYYEPVMASIMYATRFNDTDGYHRLLWFFFTMGMAGQCAFLYHSLRGFAACTGFLYFVILCAQMRVAKALPQARFLALHDAAWNAVACGIFMVICVLREFLTQRMVYLSLALHALLRPASFLSFWWLTRTPELKRSRDVPVNIWYMVSRFEGLLMMIILCSVLFPLGLAGDAFVHSGTSSALILAGNLYALLLKLSLMDVRHWGRDDLEFHAIRYGKRARAITFLLVFPYGVLGVALTGVGLVAAGKGLDAGMSRSLLSGGACLTWAVLGLSDASHSDSVPCTHALKVLGQYLGAGLCLAPWALGLDVPDTVCWILAVMILIFTCQFLPECVRTGSLPVAWQWRSVQHWKKGGRVPTGVSSNEHFFTVLLAVAVLKMNLDLGATEFIRLYVLRFCIFSGVVWSTMRYAAAFNDEDASHKLMWCVFEVTLLLMLEGLSATSVDQGNLFQLAAVGMFLVLAVCFSGRGLSSDEAADRPYWLFFTAMHGACAAVMYLEWLFDAPAALHAIVPVLLLSSDALFSLLTSGHPAWQATMNCEYVISRFNSLFMEVLGVAVIVPNAVFPGSYANPYLVALGDAIAVKIAVSIKAGIFDVEPVNHEKHAINKGPVRRYTYLAMNLCILFALSLLGGALPLLIASSGREGLVGRNQFAQLCACCAGFLLWAALAVTKFVHDFASDLRVHNIKAAVHVVGAFISILPLALRVGDFACLCLVAAAAQAVEWTQYGLFCG